VKNGTVRIGIGTVDGAYILSSEDRSAWKKTHRMMKGESVNYMITSPAGRFLASTLSDGIFISDDSNKWVRSSKGLTVNKVWSVEQDAHADNTVYAGTQYGHMFRSENSGESWEEVTGLYKAPHRENWGIDWGFGTTGLAVHTIKSDPKVKGRLYIIAAGNGAYRSDDSGDTWESIRTGIMDDCNLDFKAERSGKDRKTASGIKKEHLQSVHMCAHKIALSPSMTDVVYQQNHCGVYSTRNAGTKWKDISPTSETRHGFGITVTKGNKDTIFTVPAYQTGCKMKHNSCIQGQLSVMRSNDSGKTWKQLTNGLPKNVHNCVLRDCVTSDGLKNPGVYFGTTTGEVYASVDNGNTWNEIANGFGRIQGLSYLGA
jgi:photosystem II stability/assembly factor-like uncharacterized protein